MNVVAGLLLAQGITSAALQGRVTTAAGNPIATAEVAVTNQATGQRWRAPVGASGRYLFESLPIGGTYLVEARSIGYARAERRGVALALGQRLLLDFVLQSFAARLAPVLVSAERGAGNPGPSQRVSDSLLRRAPILNRDVLSLVRQSPLATLGTFGISIGGQNPRHNAWRIDGGENGSLYGQFAGTPGGFINLLSPPGGGGLRSIALDAVEELVVLAAPFDVRFGGFSGGLINTVTKSGSNALHGSLFGSLQHWRLVGRGLTGGQLPPFRTGQFGASVGGPVIRDRLHFFVAADLQESGLPYGGPLIRADTTGGRDSAGVGIRAGSAIRLREILRDGFGVDAGGFGAPRPANPARSLFGKLTLQTGVNGRLEVSQSYVHGLVESALLTRDPYGIYALGSADTRIRSTTTATRLSWKALLGGRVSEELTLAYLSIHDLCDPVGAFARISVPADLGVLVAGQDPICPGRPVRQQVLELSNNLSFLAGPHRLTIGTHDELLGFRDPATIFNGYGTWEFGSLDSLELGLANRYNRSLAGPQRPEGTIADFRVRQLGVYAQDEWSPVERVELTLGLRLDVPLFPDRPLLNSDLLQQLGVNTSTVPHTALLWSPRFGIRYRPGGGGVLRAGIGVFSGRPAYVFPADAYRSTGLEQFFLSCSGDDTPAFTPVLGSQPTACRSGQAVGAPRVAFFDPRYRPPQELKLSAGYDRRLPGGLTGSLDLLLGHGIHEPYFRDVNLAPTGAVLSGEAGRVLYGALDALGARPNRISPDYTTVVEETSRAGTRSLQASIQIARPLTRGVGFEAAYTFSDVRDRMLNGDGLGYSLSGYGLAADQIGSTVLDGTSEHRRLRPAALQVRHKLRLLAMADLPLGIQLTGIYEGASGNPFTYVVNGDINADGFGDEVFGQQSNDPVYVPRVAGPGGDVTLVDDTGAAAGAAEYDRLASYIGSESCLRENRGGLLPRNSCRNPWTSVLDVRVTKLFTRGTARGLELSADVFNLLHLLDRDWGVVRRTADFGLEEVPLLRLAGYDAVHDRGVYRLDLRDRRHVDLDASRWRMQLSARYVF